MRGGAEPGSGSVPPGTTPSAAPTLGELYDLLLSAYGPQHWWPGDGPFEVLVGAVLTQNTAWRNVERALEGLRIAGALNPEAIVAARPDRLAAWIRSAGTHNVKAARLQGLCRWFLESGGFAALARSPLPQLRQALLSIKGVGPETADDILLYAFGRPVFVIDAYTRRILGRLGLARGDEGYEALRGAMESGLPAEPGLFGEYHALLVAHAKAVCRPRPLCGACCLRPRCPAGAAPGEGCGASAKAPRRRRKTPPE
ncbi:MAG: endonuclease [Gammaproteobacteria bacterium]|nr:endonuclease [Gammaproteobacteria bacterium]